MYDMIKKSVSLCMKGKITKCAVKVLMSRLMKLVFFMYSVSSIYLFVFDTSLIVSLGVFDNEYISALLCASVVLIGFLLLLVSVWTNFSAKIYNYSQIQNIENKRFSIPYAIKLLFLYLYCTVAKFFTVMIACIPALSVGAVLYKYLSDGISLFVAVVLGASVIVLFILGLYCGLIICQRYSLVEYSSVITKFERVKDIINCSIYLMSGKCADIFKLKMKNLPLKILGLIIPSLNIVANSREFFFATDKTIEYAHKEHTQKPIVFYCGEVTA